jgi:type I restriction enzyme S subunit
MTNWKEYKLSDVIKVKHGFAFKGEYFSQTPTTDILLTPGNFNIGGGFKADKFKYYNGDYPKSYILKKGDIIVTMTDLSKEGDTLGYSAKIPQHSGIKYLHNQRLGLLELKDKSFCLDFIYWLLRTREYQQFIVSSATGTTVKHTSPTRICEYEFKAPDYNTQTAIAEILSSLDDKIELNNKINQELENLAQTLFKQWFLDFEFPNEKGDPYKSSGGELVDSLLGEIPKGWEVASLGSLLELIIDYRGKTPLKLGMNWSEVGIKAISARNVKNRSLTNLDNVHIGSQELYEIWMKDELKFGDVLLTSEAPLGETAILLDRHKFILSQRLFALRANEKISPYYLFEYLSSETGKIELERRQSGSTVVGIKQKELLEIDLLSPSVKIIKQHSELVSDIYKSIENNDNENQELTILRDTLLPKLISGELEVSEALTQTTS